EGDGRQRAARAWRAVVSLTSDSPLAPPLVPRPAKITPRDGSFVLTPLTHVQTSASLRGLGELARQYLRPATGLPLTLVESATHSRIVLSLDPRLGHFGDEGYRLTVAKDEVLIRAPHPPGVFWGLQTLRPLLPSAGFRRAL